MVSSTVSLIDTFWSSCIFTSLWFVLKSKFRRSITVHIAPPPPPPPSIPLPFHSSSSVLHELGSRLFARDSHGLVYLNIYIFLDCIQQQSFGVYFCLHSSQIIKISYVNISTRISYSGDARLDSRIEGQAFMTDFHRSFLHALQTNSGAIGQPRNRRRPLSSTQFPIHYRKSSSHSMKQLIKDHTD